MYCVPAGTLDIAFDGHERAIEQSLQFTHRLCLICIYKEPFPKSAHPLTHFAQPSQRSSLIVYSKYGSSTNFLVIAAVGHICFSALLLLAITTSLSSPAPSRAEPRCW